MFTDLSRDELVAAIRRADNRKSATEVFMPKHRPQAAPAAMVGESAVTATGRMAVIHGKSTPDTPAVAAPGGGGTGGGEESIRADAGVHGEGAPDATGSCGAGRTATQGPERGPM